jgi:hypothetical protein
MYYDVYNLNIPVSLHQIWMGFVQKSLCNLKLHGHLQNPSIDFLVFNVTFSNISAISWQPVLVVEEAGVLGENHRPWASNW